MREKNQNYTKIYNISLCIFNKYFEIPGLIFYEEIQKICDQLSAGLDISISWLNISNSC